MSVIAIAFTPAPAGESPNLRRRTATDVYYDSMIVAFATYRRFSNARLVLISDQRAPADKDSCLRELGVETMLVPFGHRPRQDLAATFTASLYSLDAVTALVREFPDEPVALLDPDCVAVSDLEDLMRRAQDALCVYPTGFPPTEGSNGLSGHEAQELHELLDPLLTTIPVHYGGECYAFTGRQMKPVLDRAEVAYEFAERRAAEGRTRFTTEEHIFNYALRGSILDEVDDLVRRIWTAPVLRTVVNDDMTLSLWHLPSEKDRGFREALPLALDRSSWFWVADPIDFRKSMGRVFGIPHRSPRRWAYDLIGSSARAMQRRLGHVS